MDFLALQTSRLVAAVPRDKASIAEAFDVDDVVTRRRGGLGVLGLVIRTPKGIEQCSQDEDPDDMNPEKGQVQVAWEDGTVANVETSELTLEDRTFSVGDSVCHAESLALGLVLDVVQTADVVVQPECAADAWTEEASPPEAEALRGIQTKSCGLPALQTQPPLLVPLQQFDHGMLVVHRGRLGSVCSGKVDYVIRLDSGHEFTLESGMKGVLQQPRRGHPVSWVSGLYPSLPVYVKGEWIRGFESQILRRHEYERRLQNGAQQTQTGAQAQSAADAAKLSKGIVKAYSMRDLRILWFCQGNIAPSQVARKADPWAPISHVSIQQPEELLPLQPLVLLMGQPVYVDVPRAKSLLQGKRLPPSGVYSVGVVDRVRTECVVLWEDGSVESAVPSRKLLPVGIDRTPLYPEACELKPLLLPHSLVLRRRRIARSEKGRSADGLGGRPAGGGSSRGAKASAGLPWWINIASGGLRRGPSSFEANGGDSSSASLGLAAVALQSESVPAAASASGGDFEEESEERGVFEETSARRAAALLRVLRELALSVTADDEQQQSHQQTSQQHQQQTDSGGDEEEDARPPSAGTRHANPTSGSAGASPETAATHLPSASRSSSSRRRSNSQLRRPPEEDADDAEADACCQRRALAFALEALSSLKTQQRLVLADACGASLSAEERRRRLRERLDRHKRNAPRTAGKFSTGRKTASALPAASDNPLVSGGAGPAASGADGASHCWRERSLLMSCAREALSALCVLLRDTQLADLLLDSPPEIVPLLRDGGGGCPLLGSEAFSSRLPRGSGASAGSSRGRSRERSRGRPSEDSEDRASESLASSERSRGRAERGDGAEEAAAAGEAGKKALSSEEMAFLLYTAQRLTDVAFGFDGGPPLEFVHSFLSFVFSYGQWAAAEGGGSEEEVLHSVFTLATLLLSCGFDGPLFEAPASSDRPRKEDGTQTAGEVDAGSAGTEAAADADCEFQLGFVVRAESKRGGAVVAWVKNRSEFAAALREKHEAFFAKGGFEGGGTAVTEEEEVFLRSLYEALEISGLDRGIRQPAEGPDVAGFYRRAAALLSDDKIGSLVDLSFEEYDAFSVFSHHLVFPGDVAFLKAKEQNGVSAERKTLLEVVAVCGGTVWTRSLDGRIAPFLLGDVLPVPAANSHDIFRPSEQSDEESEYSEEYQDDRSWMTDSETTTVSY